jgi:hypothetical protein
MATARRAEDLFHGPTTKSSTSRMTMPAIKATFARVVPKLDRDPVDIRRAAIRKVVNAVIRALPEPERLKAAKAIDVDTREVMEKSNKPASCHARHELAKTRPAERLVLRAVFKPMRQPRQINRHRLTMISAAVVGAS